MTQSREINLKPSRSFEENTTSKKVFLWMIGVGRVIVISTELLAILVWLSRFRLDFEITNLQENIEEKASLLQNTSRFEDTYQKYFQKTELIKEIESGKPRFSKSLTNLSRIVPTGVTITTLRLSENELEMEALAQTALDFAKLISQTITNPQFKQIRLTGSRYNQSDQTYLFSLTIAVDESFFK
jgi:Tfp pilus assembly protein PilN